MQSSFCKFHSVETALVKVTYDLLIASDSDCLSILVFLDLSAAFDTVDRSLLITRLEAVFGVSDNVLKWIRSYLTHRKHFVTMGGFRSEVGFVKSGVLQ